MGTGAKILQFFYELNTPVGDRNYETYRNYLLNDQGQTEKLWDGIGKAMGSGGNEIFHSVNLLDGSENSEGDPLENHFVPDRVFYLKAPDGSDVIEPELSAYQAVIDRFHNGYDDGTIVVPYATATVPELDGSFPELDEDKEDNKGEYKGYRIIIFDEDIEEDSLIRYSFKDIVPDDENKITDDYIYRNIGSSRIIYQKPGEMCIYVEHKSCLELNYGIKIDTEETDDLTSYISTITISDDPTGSSGIGEIVEGGGIGSGIGERIMPMTVSENTTELDDLVSGGWTTLISGNSSMELIGVAYDTIISLSMNIDIRFVIAGVTQVEIPLNALMTVNVSAFGSTAVSHMPYWQGRIKSSAGDWSIEARTGAPIASSAKLYVFVAHYT